MSWVTAEVCGGESRGLTRLKEETGSLREATGSSRKPGIERMWAQKTGKVPGEETEWEMVGIKPPWGSGGGRHSPWDVVAEP